MDHQFPEQVVESLYACWQQRLDSVCLHEPIFSGNEQHYINDCIASTMVSYRGAYSDQFEQLLQQTTGIENAIVTSSGTSALHTAFMLLDVQQNDEVLIPALTFVATSNAVTYCNAIPHFVEIKESTLAIDADKLAAYLENNTLMKNGHCVNKQTQRVIKACVAVHILGHAADLDKIAQVCERFSIILVEDAAGALGTTYKKHHVGHYGACSVVSFNGNKIITTGGGGALLTHNTALAKKARHITTTARQEEGFVTFHDQVAYNYRMPSLNAALGCAQLEQLSDILGCKRRLAQQYIDFYDNVDGLDMVIESTDSHSNYWLNAWRLHEPHVQVRDAIIAAGRQRGIQLSPLWQLQHQLPMYHHCPRMSTPIAYKVFQSIILLPSSVGLINYE